MAIFDKWYNGEGIGRQDQNGFDQIKNADIHYETGYVRCQFAISSESTTPNEDAIAVTIPNGDVFFFSTESGKIWKRKYADSVYSLVATNTNTPHRGAYYFAGYLYYIAGTTGIIGRQAEGVASSEASWSSNTNTWNTLTTVATTGLIPMIELYDYLYIGGQRYVASISESAHTFDATVLDIPVGYDIKGLARSDTYLIIAADSNASAPVIKIFGWDTISSSYTFDDMVPESSFGCFIHTDDFLYMVCGTSGQMYYWSGKSAIKWKRLRNATTEHNPYAATTLNGRALYGTADGDVYSITSASQGLPYAIVQEYTVSAVKSLAVTNGVLLASTGDNISKLSTTAYATAVIALPERKGSIEKLEVVYDSLPASCTLGLESKVNGGAWTSETNFLNDTTNMKYVLANGVTYDGTIVYSQFRITLNPYNTTPSTPVLREVVME